jgi:hypothetical protein
MQLQGVTKMGTSLWWIIAALVVVWIVGLVLDLIGGLIHIVLVAAAVLFVLNMLTSRRRV